MRLFIADSAKKDFEKISKNGQQKIHKKTFILEHNPFAGKKLSGELEGLYSLKVWPYRVIYLIKKNGEVWIIHVFHRQGAYK